MTSFGATLDRSCIIVEVHGDGVKGLAECVAFEGPWYSYETLGTAWHIMSDYLIPRLLEADLESAKSAWEVFKPIRGHNMAKAALEMACWDLAARSQEVSLSTLLGGTRSRVPVGVSIGIQSSPEELVEAVGRYLDAGYRRIKLKIAPGQDSAYASAVRRSYPDALIQVDANSAYTLDDAEVFEAMDDLGLLLIEQPLGP
ncbi:MAG TPA: enolase C-terminal domain-like protein, partial [Chloroflexota bacterium]|nr:enolase C-terminal domain-like protein [Chloroflexota bacterium]